MNGLDPRTHLLCWHATAIANYDAILANGFRAREERVYVAVHPTHPLWLGRKFNHPCVLFTLALPLTGDQAWTIGSDCMIGHWECYLRRAVPRTCIIDHCEPEAAAAWPRFGVSGMAARSQIVPGLDATGGYAGWLPDPVDFLKRCRETLCEFSSNGTTAVLAALYLAYDRSKTTETAATDMVSSAMLHALVSDSHVDPGTRRAAADILAHHSVSWLPRAARLPPPASFAHALLVTALGRRAPGSDQDKDTLAGACSRALDERRARHLAAFDIVLCGGKLPAQAFSDADSHTLTGLVDVVRQVPLGTAIGKCALDAIASLPESLADQGLVELLRHQRAVPSRARQHLAMLLGSRVDRIRPALQVIAESMDGRPQRIALRLLGKQTAVALCSED
jgi:hypothetical protein